MNFRTKFTNGYVARILTKLVYIHVQVYPSYHPSHAEGRGQFLYRGLWLMPDLGGGQGRGDDLRYLHLSWPEIKEYGQNPTVLCWYWIEMGEFVFFFISFVNDPIRTFMKKNIFFRSPNYRSFCIYFVRFLTERSHSNIVRSIQLFVQ